MIRNVPLLIFLVLGSCGMGPPSQEEVGNADYGDPISQTVAESQAVRFIKATLEDSDLAEFEWDPLFKGWFRDPPLFGGTLYWGYVLKGDVDAHDSRGDIGYTFLFHDGVMEAGNQDYRR